ncbi:MAG TPA: hypothetical protein VFS15_02600, partial [Kofleriaceae bacterium]|nr:hypothetical protein [Kofleriaceae bacterium]
MTRWVVVLLLAFGVTSVEAAPRKSSTSESKRRHKKKRAKDDRRPTRTTKLNMPRGFVWPPSRKMEADADACELQLDELGVAHHPAKPEGRVVRPITIDDEIAGIKLTPMYGRHFVYDCQLVLALANFA